jgi:post-segregation antitoxin (ccd killing protein)
MSQYPCNRLKGEAFPVDLTVYLPDEIGKRAKEAGLNLSRLLRDGVTNELERRDAVAATLNNVETYELDLEDEDGRAYTGRVTGSHLVTASNTRGHAEVYVTEDERVIAYDGMKRRYWVLDNPVEDLRDWLPEGVYAEVLHSLGETPVVDI